jgi:hypothetical protein
MSEPKKIPVKFNGVVIGEAEVTSDDKGSLVAIAHLNETPEAKRATEELFKSGRGDGAMSFGFTEPSAYSLRESVPSYLRPRARYLGDNNTGVQVGDGNTQRNIFNKP